MSSRNFQLPLRKVLAKVDVIRISKFWIGQPTIWFSLQKESCYNWILIRSLSDQSNICSQNNYHHHQIDDAEFNEVVAIFHSLYLDQSLVRSPFHLRLFTGSFPFASGPAANLYRPSSVYKIFCQPTTSHISFIYFRLNSLIKSKALSLFFNFQTLRFLLIYKFQMPVRRIPQKRPSLIPSHRQQIGNACHLAYATVCHHFINLKFQ